MTWRFADAPVTLRSLHCGPEIPEWLVLVPAALRSADLHEIIMQRSKQVALYETAEGDAVYVGTSLSNPPARLSSAAATHFRSRSPVRTVVTR